MPYTHKREVTLFTPKISLEILLGIGSTNYPLIDINLIILITFLLNIVLIA